MTKIKINLDHFKFWLFLSFILFLNFIYENDYSTEQKKIFLSILILLAFLTALSFFIKKISLQGFYVKNDGLLWKTKKETFEYPWDDLTIKTLIDFPFLKLIEISSKNHPKYRLLLSWLVEKKGLENILSHCPTTHELHQIIKRYLNS